MTILDFYNIVIHALAHISVPLHCGGHSDKLAGLYLIVYQTSVTTKGKIIFKEKQTY